MRALATCLCCCMVRKEFLGFSSEIDIKNCAYTDILTQVWVTRSFEHVLIIQGWFLKSGTVFSIANVYTSCDSERKQELWSRLCGWRFQCKSA
ncbi:hypothetical protein MTR_3g466340 [Medicago truncatula]|uniref:Uncharacterized protein n=1 Tax=Medicago truncatula TaxID=3880 RepID=A0A072UZ95_MEDTR|nr:hypothetical protein MTR_3g466340 [Medicago truncatula]